MGGVRARVGFFCVGSKSRVWPGGPLLSSKIGPQLQSATFANGDRSAWEMALRDRTESCD